MTNQTNALPVVAWLEDDVIGLEDLSSSACQMALSCGVGEDSFLRLARTIRDRCVAVVTEHSAHRDAELSELREQNRLLHEAGELVDAHNRAQMEEKDAELAELREQNKLLQDAGDQVDAEHAEAISVLRGLLLEVCSGLECENMHHKKSEEHAFDEPCKVLARINDQLRSISDAASTALADKCKEFVAMEAELTALRARLAELENPIVAQFTCEHPQLNNLLNATAMLFEGGGADAGIYWDQCLTEVMTILSAPSQVADGVVQVPRDDSKVIAVARKWFYETFEDDLLQKMQDHKLIAQAEGFSVSMIATLEQDLQDALLATSQEQAK